MLRTGGGPDDLTGGIGVDELTASSGDDVVNAQDGVADDVSCGTGVDQLFADLKDPAPADCEAVSASPKGEPLPLLVSPRARRARGGVRLSARCPRDHRRACTGALTLRSPKRKVGSRRYDVRAGRSASLLVRTTTRRSLRVSLSEPGGLGARTTDVRLRVR